MNSIQLNTKHPKEVHERRHLHELPVTEKIKLIYISGNPTITQLIHKKFKLIDANVSDLRDAKIICLGERHFCEQHEINNSEIINALCDKNDLILTENENDGAGEQTKHVKSPLQIKGWDKLDEKTLKAINIMEREFLPWEILQSASIFLGILSEELIRWKFTIRVPHWTYVPIFCLGVYGYHQLSKGIKKTAALVRVFEHNKKDGKSIDHSRMEIIDLAETGESLQLLMEGIPARNQHMVQKIEENLPLNRKIYVIAGLAHFEPSRCDKTGCNNKSHLSQDKGYQIVSDFLQKQKFAIFIPKLP